MKAEMTTYESLAEIAKQLEYNTAAELMADCLEIYQIHQPE